jgi:hypothetical protein
MFWKRSLIDALDATNEKLKKCYNQNQNNFELLCDKAILLHFTFDETLFQTVE